MTAPVQWTPEMDRCLTQHTLSYPPTNAIVLSEMIGVCHQLVHRRRRDLGLQVPKPGRRSREWTEDQDAMIRRARTDPGTKMSDVAKRLGISPQRLQMRAKQMGLSLKDPSKTHKGRWAQ